MEGGQINPLAVCNVDADGLPAPQRPPHCVPTAAARPVLNPTYKHLEDKLRLGPFSLGQWAQLLGAALTALVFAVYVSPLPTQATISLAILIAGIPFAISYAAMGAEFSVAEMSSAALRFYRRPRRYLPGPGELSAGYHVEPPALDTADGANPGPREPAPAEEPLWDL